MLEQFNDDHQLFLYQVSKLKFVLEINCDG